MVGGSCWWNGVLQKYMFSYASPCLEVWRFCQPAVALKTRWVGWKYWCWKLGLDPIELAKTRAFPSLFLMEKLWGPLFSQASSTSSFALCFKNECDVNWFLLSTFFLLAPLAKLSASSLPTIPTCPGHQESWIEQLSASFLIWCEKEFSLFFILRRLAWLSLKIW